ncbi:hypothetical protein CQW49_09815 [Methylosinus trichosporium OB3b]|uniref:Uncharacterized protein n=1 Tax=Methylosinus trichosporium (strain ATCC 35070 / NCIMB 11131 / UNIQEM 75 / OB3b) TaxID=595536 RepID=A0A2D2CZG3_METT3|nr:hypothetical protein CQW49_09815 [Methylosinus trichosporium OB3b]OBS53535.1 hypothetical protein A8B73_05630 [Methylosinus sp. 3S-1]
MRVVGKISGADPPRHCIEEAPGSGQRHGLRGKHIATCLAEFVFRYQSPLSPARFVRDARP